MGISIYYNGKFNKDAELSKLVNEVQDIVKILKWDYRIFNKSFPGNEEKIQKHDGKIYGMIFTPPGCETVSICFLSNRRMSCLSNLIFYGNATKKPDADYLYMLSTKTQFAGTSIHKTIIQIFRYLIKKNYFEEFNLLDDGEYWETNNEDLLEQKFRINAGLIDDFSIAIESIPRKKDENYDKYFKRIIQKIEKRNSK